MCRLDGLELGDDLLFAPLIPIGMVFECWTASLVSELFVDMPYELLTLTQLPELLLDVLRLCVGLQTKVCIVVPSDVRFHHVDPALEAMLEVRTIVKLHYRRSVSGRCCLAYPVIRMFRSSPTVQACRIEAQAKGLYVLRWTGTKVKPPKDIVRIESGTD